MRRLLTIACFLAPLALVGCGDKPGQDKQPAGQQQQNQPASNTDGQIEETPDDSKTEDAASEDSKPGEKEKEPIILCPNGRLNPGETCDDGNAEDGDGCDSNCQVEAGYECFYSPSECRLSCSNGHLDDGEECDDGNLEDGDGCDNSCHIEAGYDCDTWSIPTICETICGNGYLDEDEECDDGNSNNDDGCSECRLQAGFDCNVLVEPTHCMPWCGNGYYDEGEECDDGNANNDDGCSECHIMPGFDCFTDAEPTLCRPLGSPYEGSCDNPFILDDSGLKISGVNFKDRYHGLLIVKAKVKKGDEITALLKSNVSYQIEFAPGSCKTSGTYKPNDMARKEITYDTTMFLKITENKNSVAVSSNVYYDFEFGLRHIGCGDGILDETEICDDGNTENGDGCDENCIVESDGHCQTAFIKGDALAEASSLKTSHCEHGDEIWSGFGDSCEYPAVLNAEEGIFDFGPMWERWTNKHDFKDSNCSYKKYFYNEAVLKVVLAPHEKISITSNIPLPLMVMKNECSNTTPCVTTKLNPSFVNNTEETVTYYFIGKGEYTSYIGVAQTIDNMSIYFKREKYEGFCGDGRADTMYIDDRKEGCDDGNNIDGDGCSSSCQVEKFWSCTLAEGAKSDCHLLTRSLPYVGMTINFNVDTDTSYLVDKYCYDGNDEVGDGCSNFLIESGWSCWKRTSNIKAEYINCYRLCGDGLIGAGESCDDGNYQDGDGCSHDCQVEAGYSCSGNKCYLVDFTDQEHSGDTKDDAFIMAGEGIYTTFDGLTEEGNIYTDKYQLDSSCEGYDSSASDLKEVIYKADLKSGQLLFTSLRNNKSETNYTINIIRDFADNGQVSCYRRDTQNSYFAPVDQTVYIMVEEKSANQTAPVAADIAINKYYPVCGDGLIEGFEECDPAAPGFNTSAIDPVKMCDSNCTITSNHAYSGCVGFRTYSSNQTSFCSDSLGFTGYPLTCGGGGMHDGKTEEITMNFKNITGVRLDYTQDYYYERSNYIGVWRPDLSCEKVPSSYRPNEYKSPMILRYNVRAGDTLVYQGDDNDYFYVLEDDCWHSKCLASFKTSGKWTASEDRQVWVVMYPKSSFPSFANTLTLKRAE